MWRNIGSARSLGWNRIIQDVSRYLHHHVAQTFIITDEQRTHANSIAFI